MSLRHCQNHEQDCDGILLKQFVDHYVCPKCRMGFVLTPTNRIVPQPKGRK